MKATMPNCYIHPDRRARWGCVLCGKSICGECSNWVAENVYMCPNCREQTSLTPEKTRALKPIFPKALYFVTAAVIVVVGAWYVFGTYIAPRIFVPPYP
jgi:hypothetical protein